MPLHIRAHTRTRNKCFGGFFVFLFKTASSALSIVLTA